MNRQKKQFVLCVILLAIAVIVFFGMRFARDRQEEEQTEDGEQQLVVYAVETDDLVGFSYDTVSGESMEFYKDGEQWLCRGHEEADLSEESINAALGIVSSVTANTIIEDGSPEEFGLDAPSAKITVNTGGETVTFTFGIQNSMTQEHYFIINGDTSQIYSGDGAILSLAESTYEDYLVQPGETE